MLQSDKDITRNIRIFIAPRAGIGREIGEQRAHIEGQCVDIKSEEKMNALQSY